MKPQRLVPIACKEPIHPPRTEDDVIAETLAIIRGRVFGRRSTEVKLLKLRLQQEGYEIVATNERSAP